MGDSMSVNPGALTQHPRIYVCAQGPELNRRYANEMASYKEEAGGTYCPMCMDLDCSKTLLRERGARARGARAPGAVSLEVRNVLDFYMCCVLRSVRDAARVQGKQD